MKEKIQKLIKYHNMHIYNILTAEATKEIKDVFNSWRYDNCFDLVSSEDNGKVKEIYSKLEFHQEAIWTLIELEKDSETASHIKSLVKIWSK